MAGYTETIGARFQQDRAAALALPAYPFDACIRQPAEVDKYQTVRFDNNRYSVPRWCAYRGVTVKGYVDRVEVVAGDQVVARHARCYGRDEQILDPLHYLAALERRPAALDHAPVLRDWQLPEVFTRLRQELEKAHGPRTGVRHYVRVLQLLGEHPLPRVQQAVQKCLGQQLPCAERIKAQTLRLGQSRENDPGVTVGGHSTEEALAQYAVPVPDLKKFDQLLNQGACDDGR